MNSRHGVEATIQVRERAGREREHKYSCVLSRDLHLNYSRLERYCWAKLTPLDVDLLVVAGACAFADRVVRRRQGTAWSRLLHISVPVHERIHWASPPVRESLQAALNYLTGDHWNLSFVQRKARDRKALQLPLLTRNLGPCAVLAYSGGLDSFAQLRLERLAHPERTPLLVTTEHGGVSAVVGSTVFHHGNVERVGIPLSPRVGEHAEPTFRTRMLLFLSSAAVAWHLANADEIVLAEPGQGAVGPSLVPFGNEHPYRGAHPGFTTRFAAFLNALWGRAAPRISHPNIWKTKAQLLAELKAKRVLEGWETTVSCSRNVARQKGRGVARQCGICGGCLLRRISLSTIGVTEAPNSYYWSNLDADSLQASSSRVPENGRTKTSKADKEVAISAVLDHANLARAAESIDDNEEIDRVAQELRDVMSLDAKTVAHNLQSLLVSHKQEWISFLSTLAPASWVVRLAQGNR